MTTDPDGPGTFGERRPDRGSVVPVGAVRRPSISGVRPPDPAPGATVPPNWRLGGRLGSPGIVSGANSTGSPGRPQGTCVPIVRMFTSGLSRPCLAGAKQPAGLRAAATIGGHMAVENSAPAPAIRSLVRDAV